MIFYNNLILLASPYAKNCVLSRLSCFIRWALGLIFIYAGFSKLLDPSAFAAVVSDIGILPAALLMPMATALPVVEIIAGLGIIIGYDWALPVAAILLIGFAGVSA